jgi:hypothetical protein
MKYLLLLTLLCSIGCIPDISSHIHNSAISTPKFKAGQSLKITEGFYSDATKFVVTDFERHMCQYGTEYYREFVYKGKAYIPGMGPIDASICEGNLKSL